MKKRIALLLVLLTVLCLAACSGQADPGVTTAPSQLLENCRHADADANTYCDHCGGSVLVELDIYAINDLHGKFSDTDTQPGVDELSTYLTLNPDNTILLSSGDMWQGTSESNLTRGALVTEWMNHLDFVSMTLGNHEFDWGESYIESNAQLAQFPFLAINVYDRTTNTLVDYCQPSVMVERSGVTVGIIGAIGDCYSSISGDHSKDVYFQVGSDLNALVKAEADRLRQAGADIIIYSVHDGSSDETLTDGYVDLVFEGHSHQSYSKKDANGVYHVQGGGENRGISYAQIHYNIVTDRIETVSAKVINNSIYSSVKPHAVVKLLLQQYADQIDQGNQVLGYNEKLRDGDWLRQVCAQLYYRKGVEKWGEDYDIVLGGGFMSVRSPYELAAGNVTYSQLQSIFPFDNQLVLCSVKGEDLLRKFFETDNSNYFIYYEAYGQQVYDQIDRNATYYIVTDTYSSTYAPNRLTEIQRYGEDIFARDLLAEYISQGKMDRPTVPQEQVLTDIASLLRICGELVPGATGSESYFVKGVVTDIASDRYGNMTIRDEKGDELFIYGVYDADGQNRYDAMEQPPQVGDEIILWGPMKYYVSMDGEVIFEMVNARVVG